jgi:hypothetical protein
MARLYARNAPRHGKPIACHRARQGIAHGKAIKAKAWQALPIACHRAGQGIAHGKAIKAKASGRQGMAGLYARKSLGMASR